MEAQRRQSRPYFVGKGTGTLNKIPKQTKTQRRKKLHKSALVAALLVSACSCVTVMAAETVPANSQIFKEAKSLPKVPANPKVFTGKAEVIPMSQQVPGMPVHKWNCDF